MRTVGWFTTVVVGIAAALALFAGARSLPDIKRYLKIRGM
jgi:hypothetical protein